MGNKQAHALAAIFERCVVTAFESKKQDGRMFVQILFPDGSGLTAKMDDCGNPHIRYLASNHLDENELDNGCDVDGGWANEFDGVLVESGHTP